MANYGFQRVSANRKLGPIPSVYVSSETCPDSCPLKDGNGCYGEAGRIVLHWRKVDAGQYTVDIDGLGALIAALPRRTLWRYAVVGDLPGKGDFIDREALKVIVEANKARNGRGFAFSHKPVGFGSPMETMNALAIMEANANGFTISLSADDLEEADALYDLGIAPVVVTLPTDAPMHPVKTPKGRVVASCPAERRPPGEIQCDQCGICSNLDRKVITGFHAHGALKNRINRRLKVIQPGSPAAAPMEQEAA